jgi:hypothetical protein
MDKCLQIVLDGGQSFSLVLEEREAKEIINDWTHNKLPEYFASRNVKTLKDGGIWAMRTKDIKLMNVAILQAQPAGSTNPGIVHNSGIQTRRN